MLQVTKQKRRKHWVKNSASTAKNEVAGSREEEPPGCQSITSDKEDEPPSETAAVNKNRFFGDVTDESWNDWKWQCRNRIATVKELSRFIPLTAKEKAQLELVTAKFPLSITPYYLCLINTDDPNDPIRKQAVPSFQELALAGMGVEDPLEEKKDSVVSGLVHRYPDRVLMVLTNLCPVLCRHCTRKREWRHGGWVRTSDEIKSMLDYIRSNENVRDVVISGGDPLTLSTHRLEEVISGLRQIEHVEIIRIGTRLPVVLPQRIDEELCTMLSRYGPIWLNTHFNHAREITQQSAQACDRLLRSGVPVNNQSVLLRGLNDTVQAQTKLCHGLLKIKVRPYYLYQCDEVQGTEHLRTPVETGISIIEGMRGHTSGLAIPTFVVDLPHGGGKVPLQPNYVISQKKDELILRNYKYNPFRYRNPGVNGARRNGHRNGKRSNDTTNSPVVQTTTMPLSKGADNENRTLVRS